MVIEGAAAVDEETGSSVALGQDGGLLAAGSIMERLSVRMVKRLANGI